MPYDQTQPTQNFTQTGQQSAGQTPYNQAEQQSASQTPYNQPQQTVLPKHFNSAYAIITPGPDYPAIRGLVTFADIPGGVMICADVAGLPPYAPAAGNKSPIGPFGFHIHEKGNCEVGNPANPFESAGGHWNPTNQPHGNHAGDFPVLVADNGRARMTFILSRFTVDEILGRSVMIHENPDDYRTQPAGNSGKKIACGSIKPWNAYQQYMQ
jgi:Cu-Zn family superoxide dismutase